MNRPTLTLWLSLSLCGMNTGALAAEYPAQLDWSGRVSLAMPVSGIVATAPAQAGQHLKKGELLAALDTTLFKARVAETKAAVSQFLQEDTDAQRDLERVSELYARTVSATTELDAAKLRRARAAAQLAAAEARLEMSRHQLQEAEMRAPFDAIILNRMVEPGLIAATPCQPNPLFTIARDHELLARTLLDAQHASRIRLGERVEVLAAGRPFSGEIRSLSVTAANQYSLEVALAREADLTPGLAATIRLP